MATVLFSVAGAAIGGSVGGSLAGLSTIAIGRAAGATLGRVIDQRLLGQGGQAIETGKVDRFRLTGAGEGDPIPQLFGRMRLGGHVIWASDFLERTATSGGGKGAGGQSSTTEYTYSVSLAIAVCEGEITRVGRVWADGQEVAPDDLNMRVYSGSQDQLPDPTMEAIEGVGQVPAYRGTAYVVMEELALGQFGNRVPQFTFEVLRPEQPDVEGWEHTPAFGIQGAALIPGTGEYALATTPVNFRDATGAYNSANVSTPAGKPDFLAATQAMTEELPNLKAVSVVVSWFGDDLRCSNCTIRPKVEHVGYDAENMPWSSSALVRENAFTIGQQDGRPVYGGTPSDTSVIEAIVALKNAGKEVLFYPFILMDQLEGNGLPDPYGEGAEQPKLPWRGRITLSKAPEVAGSPDGTAVADAEIAAFFGDATAANFEVVEGEIVYTATAEEDSETTGSGGSGDEGSGETGEGGEGGEGDGGSVVDGEGEDDGPYEDDPTDWSFSRFILHNAMVCLQAGGVEAFCIGSEMRGITQIRGEGGAFVAVQHLRALAAQVRAILGPDTLISYAADWTEYFGYQPQDGSGDRYFHLDPLWSDSNIDFVAIDNYMPLSDWRDTPGHLDSAAWDAPHNLEYLKSNIEGGEGYDWYYASPADRDAQLRTPIADGAHQEPWVFRYKDLRGWWGNSHYERIAGQRAATPTGWTPMSKPIWFTEYGCAAIDKGTNQPNKFLDSKSSESSLPHYSSGGRDELIQMQYLRAMSEYWNNSANNPVSPSYGAPMLDMSRAMVWAFDARPYPFFPNNIEKWSDGDNYTRGHWINGRTAARTLASIVGEICRSAGLQNFSTEGLYGYVRGYTVDQVSDARAALQPLMIRYGFDAIERGGTLEFRMRQGRAPVALDPALFAMSGELDGSAEQVREAEAEVSGRMRLRFVQADADFEVISEEAVLADEATHSVSGSEVNIALSRGEGRQIAERWLTEARVARDTVKLALPPSQMHLGAGDVIELPGEAAERPARYRIDRIEQSDVQLIEGVRIEPEVYDVANIYDPVVQARSFVAPVPVVSQFMDLPLLRGDEVPYAPHLALTAKPWPGPVAVFQSTTDANYKINTVVSSRATIGVTRTVLERAAAGVMDRGAGLEVELISGSLSSVTEAALLSGANLAAIGDGSADTWEVFQFRDAELVGPQTYRLSNRLRGQAGSDAIVPQSWPEGARFVLLDGSAKQIELAPSLRGVGLDFRIGPASRSNDDASYRHVQESFSGAGLRPYSPCHLRAETLVGGDISVGWIRRTRIDGDGWDAPEVPLGEESQSFVVRVTKAGALIREEIVGGTFWVYSAALQGVDAAVVPYDISVAQVSPSFGLGPFADITITT